MSKTVKIVQPTGILDGINANQLRRDIVDFVEKGADIILVDLRDIDLMNSTGLGALVATLKTVNSAGRQLFLCAPSDQVRLIFELTKMNRIFKIFSSRDEFEQNVVSVN
jgi:anti-anti-sigma factor